MEREINCDARGRPYTESLEVRAEKARDIVCRLTSERRTTRISIPAGDLLHAEPCGDEDMYLCDVLRDLSAEVAELRSRAEGAEALLRKCAATFRGEGYGSTADAIDAHLTPAPQPKPDNTKED